MPNKKMSRLLFYFLLLSTCNSFVYSQSIQKDSIFKMVSKIKDPIKKIDRFNREIERMWLLGDYTNAYLYSKETQKLALKKHYKKGLSDAIVNEGIINDYRGKYPEAINLYLKALTIQLKNNDQDGLAKNYINLGLVYQNQGSSTKALEYYEKSLVINKKSNDLNGISAAINNIGIIYMHQEKYDLALKNYLFCIDVDKKLKDSIATADTYNNIGLIYSLQGNVNNAKKYFSNSLQIRLDLGDQNGICNSYINLADLAFDHKKYNEAKKYYLKALVIAKELGTNNSMQIIYSKLTKISRKEKNLKAELNYFKLSINYRDSITNEANIKKQTQDEMQYLFDQKEAENKLKLHKQKIITDQEERKQEIILGAISVITIITILFALFLNKRWKIAQHQTKIIEEQKLLVEDKNILVEEKNKLVESKNNEILDSINYAKRIQRAILPTEKSLNNYLQNSFVLYKPKDIVAGDFYWLEKINDQLIFAVADCTGHGVPGALVSVVCHNALNRSVREFGLSKSGEILDKTREIIVGEFEKSEENVTDGMDISLCSLNLKSMILEWSGANNPLWLVRKDQNEIQEIKPNKQPIGKHFNYESFETHTIKIEKGDTLYLFTDGFSDQFGGQNEKKFKSKNMKELILKVVHKPMHDQQVIFNSTFENWKGNIEQVDDVCVIGVKF
jgi:serine phosphatase RsbU (regulator of sigma subunit)/tetratricopeptide (TPR) repeat protein